MNTIGRLTNRDAFPATLDEALSSLLCQCVSTPLHHSGPAVSCQYLRKRDLDALCALRTPQKIIEKSKKFKSNCIVFYDGKDLVFEIKMHMQRHGDPKFPLTVRAFSDVCNYVDKSFDESTDSEGVFVVEMLAT